MAILHIEDAMGRVNACVSAAALAATLIASPPAVNDAQAQQNVAYRIADAMKLATEYSSKTDGIGLVVFYGTGNEVSADEIGSKFVAGLKKRGAEARYFVANIPKAGASVAFHLGEVTRGPMSIPDAIKAVDEAVATNNVKNKLLGTGSGSK